MTLSRSLILWIFLFLISSYSCGQNAQDKKSTNPSKHSKNSQNIKNPSFVKMETKIPTDKSQDNEKAKIYAPYTWSVDNWLTFFLACITGFLAWYTFGLFSETKRLVDSSADTSKRELRAYISVSSPKDGKLIPDLHEPAIDRKAVLVIKNTGKTPAIDIEVDAVACVLPLNLKDFKYPLITDNDGSIFNLGTEEDADLPIPIQGNLTIAEWTNLIDSEDQRIYVYGTVFYKDVFWKKGEERKHTNFCLRVDNFRTSPLNYNRAWIKTREHNDAT